MRLNKRMALFVAISILCKNFSLAKDFNFSTIEKAIVKIKSTPSLTIYGKEIEKARFGCIVDRKKGLILTTKEAINSHSVCKYEITLYDGFKLIGNLKYFDSWLNFAILQIDPNQLPKGVSEISFAKNYNCKYIDLYILSDNADSKVSCSKCKPIDTKVVLNFPLPQQCYRAQFYNTGFFTSSPVLNSNGEIVSLVSLQGDNSVFFADPSYLKLFLNGQNKLHLPSRKHIGAICVLQSLYDFVEYRNIDKQILQNYLEKYPDSKGEIVVVSKLINGTPASKKLKIGDVVLAVDGIEIGPNLSILDNQLSTTSNSFVTLKILRNGNLENIEVDLYDLEKYKIKSFIQLCSTIFFEADEFYSMATGINIGELSVYKSSNNAFQKMASYPLEGNEYILMSYNFEFMMQPITSLETLKNFIPKMYEMKNFSLKYRTVVPEFNPFSDFYSGSFCTTRRIAFISMDDSDANLNAYTFNSFNNSWEINKSA